jgi:hypothetical protein
MEFKLIRNGELPKLAHQAIERAIESFMNDTNLKDDYVGFFTQTINNVHASVFRNSGDFWLAVDDEGEVMAYCLGHVTTDIDNTLTYWLSQAWVHQSLRGKQQVKAYWQQIREQAKKYFCRHIVVVSGRGTEGYCRWLGQGWTEYARLLKEDI